MRVLVLGGGRQGRIVAQALAPHARVTLLDLRPVDLAGVEFVQEDAENVEALARRAKDHDLLVGCLPSRTGTQAWNAAIEAKRILVDLSFSAQDPFEFDEPARRAGISLVPDCGLAPGLSNLIVGQEIAQGMPEAVHIRVGGVARDPARPYGYVVTWSVEDLLEEYTRPARILRGGRRISVPALSGIERVRIPGVGEMEAFFTDGLRTLLRCGVPEMTEKTLRWPGHAESVRPLLENGTFVREISASCAGGEDLVVLLLRIARRGVEKKYLMIDRPPGGWTAMSRTTALTCAAIARWVLTGAAIRPGVVPPEEIGAAAWGFVREALARHGIFVAEGQGTME